MNYNIYSTMVRARRLMKKNLAYIEKKSVLKNDDF